MWAWRPLRAKQMGQYFDPVLALFPFEAEYFEKSDILKLLSKRDCSVKIFSSDSKIAGSLDFNLTSFSACKALTASSLVTSTIC